MAVQLHSVRVEPRDTSSIIYNILPLAAPQWLCIPFAWNHEAVGQVTAEEMDWVGSVDGRWGYYVDYSLLLVFGGIPWQVRTGS